VFDPEADSRVPEDDVVLRVVPLDPPPDKVLIRRRPRLRAARVQHVQQVGRVGRVPPAEVQGRLPDALAPQEADDQGPERLALPPGPGAGQASPPSPAGRGRPPPAPRRPATAGPAPTRTARRPPPKGRRPGRSGTRHTGGSRPRSRRTGTPPRPAAGR